MVPRTAAMLALALSCSAALAGHPSYQECQEGAQFIRNAALARDAGATRAAFIGRMEDDFLLIRAFPPALRWFVRDASDEVFLRAAATEVFDAPAAAAAHESAFLVACAERSVETAASESAAGVGRMR